MNNNESILEKLRENNPFASQTSPLPWDNENPDLQQLNRDTSEEIEQLLRHKRREPSAPLAGLIVGGTGSGKTHMLMRILRKLRENKNPAIFVIVEMLRDPERINQDLLSSIFISLRHPHSKGRSQFDVVVDEVMSVYEERRRNDGYDDLSKIDKRVYLARDMPRLDRDFLKGLLLYANTNDEAERFEILEWLERGLDDEDSQRLGLPLRNIDSMSDSKRESDAEKMLVSLGLVLGYAKIPMIICFDQLEAIRSKELVNALGDLISFFVNNMPGILPLCFIKPETWENVFIPVLDSSVVRRLNGNKMIMKACTQNQAEQLIKDRITYTFAENSEEIYQWLIGRIGNTLKPFTPPAEILDYVNRFILSTETGDEEKEIHRAVSSAYDEEYKRVQSEVRSWPPKAENLTLSLSVWLESHEGFDISQSTDKYIKLIGNYNGQKYAFVILTAKGHSTVSAGLRHGMEFMKEYPESECWYITEDKTHKRTWKQANENLARFKDAGGHVIMLDKETRINWYALTALINRTDNGDLNLYLPSESRTASRDDIKTFVRNIKLIPDIFNDKNNKGKSLNLRPSIEPDVLGVNLRSIVNISPMHMITVEKAIEMLSRRKIIITRNELISFLKNNARVFRTFNSNNDMLISLLK